MGLEAIHPGPRTTTRNPDHKIYPYLLRVLEKYRGRIDRCAEHCGLSRRSISEKLRRYQIDKADFKAARRPRKPAPPFAMTADMAAS
jgi:DNA-binding NtrC family response regulator